MKRVRQFRAPPVVVALGALLVLFVGGAFAVSYVFPDHNQTTPTSTPLPTSTVDPVANKLFLGFVRNRYPELAGASDRLLEQAGSDACTVFQGGGELSDVYARIPESSPFTTHELAELVAVGVQSYCPQFLDKLTP
ncbi:MAG TPA: DUF732 domain-containing protein [Galbitalea sp.]|jgi:hypothetical protein|nr:DUF732 domain-containing protein [Galbitalea sp.]